jgi:hypothetical protein
MKGMAEDDLVRNSLAYDNGFLEFNVPGRRA